MKKIIAISAIILILLNAGCKKENQYPSKVVKASYPTVTLVGNAITVVGQGATFNDPGATWIDSLTGETGTVNATATPNTSTEGLTVLTYTAKNKNGFEASATRVVAVTGISNAFDVSGDYARTANGALAHVTKIGQGLFSTDNVSGSTTTTKDAAFFMFTSDSSIIMPDQYLPNFGAQAGFINPVYNFTASPPNYSYIVDNANVFAPSVRTFEKQ